MSVHFLHFSGFLGVRGLPGAILEEDLPKSPKPYNFGPPFGGLFWTMLAPKSHFSAFCWGLFFCLFLASLLGGLRLPFGVILGSMLGSFCRLFCRSCKSEKMQPLSSEIAVFGGAGLPFSHFFCYFLQAFFNVAFRNAFLPNLADFGPHMGFLWGPILADFPNFG